MTNGDAIKAMFPDVEVKEKNNGYEVYFGIGTAIQFFNHQWWNAPYKENIGEFSDGYHTFNQLYHQRAVLFACIVRQNKNKAWKSFKHSDGKYCFDKNGEWFIVGVDTPQGSYTYHYAKEYWDMFDCQELECGKEWDGHTEEDVNRLLSLEQQHCEDVTYICDGKKCPECSIQCRHTTDISHAKNFKPVMSTDGKTILSYEEDGYFDRLTKVLTKEILAKASLQFNTPTHEEYTERYNHTQSEGAYDE